MSRSWLVVAAGCCLFALSSPVQAGAGSPGGSCSSQADAGKCDVDADGIVDSIEEQICGLVTCADGTEDVDADAVPDWVELTVCGTRTCVDATTDSDHLGIPDWVEVVICGTAECATGREDANADGMPDWLSVVLCGTATCARPGADLDRNGVEDRVELARVEAAPGGPVGGGGGGGGSGGGRGGSGRLPFSGADVSSMVAIGLVLVAVGSFSMVVVRRRRMGAES